MHQDADTTSTAIPRVPLDAYPRLCGLPVTIERLVPATSVAAPAERVAPPPRARARARRPVARTVVVVLVVVAAVFAVASEARAETPLPSVQARAA